MSTMKVFGHVDEFHRLSATVPDSVGPGQIEVLLIVPASDEADADAEWSNGIAREWHAELSDPCEDIYSLLDGAPVDEPR